MAESQLSNILKTIETFDRSNEAAAAPIVAKGLELLNSSSASPLVLEAQNVLFRSLGAMHDNDGVGVHSRHTTKLTDYVKQICTKDRVNLQDKAVNVAVALEAATSLLGRQRLAVATFPLTLSPHPVKTTDLCARLAAIRFAPCLSVIPTTSSPFAATPVTNVAPFGDEAFAFLAKGYEAKDYRIRRASLQSLYKGTTYYNLRFTPYQTGKLLEQLPRIADDSACTTSEAADDCGLVIGLALAVNLRGKMPQSGAVAPSLGSLLSQTVQFFKNQFSASMTRRRQSMLSCALGKILVECKRITEPSDEAGAPSISLTSTTVIMEHLLDALLSPESSDEKAYGPRLFSKALQIWTSFFDSEEEWNNYSEVLKKRLANPTVLQPAQRNSTLAILHSLGVAASHNLWSAATVSELTTATVKLFSSGASPSTSGGNGGGAGNSVIFTAATDVLTQLISSRQGAIVHADVIRFAEECHSNGALSTLLWVLRVLSQGAQLPRENLEQNQPSYKQLFFDVLALPAANNPSDKRIEMFHLAAVALLESDVSTSTSDQPQLSTVNFDEDHFFGGGVAATTPSPTLSSLSSPLSEICKRFIVPNTLIHLNALSVKSSGGGGTVGAGSWKAVALAAKTLRLVVKNRMAEIDVTVLSHLLMWTLTSQTVSSATTKAIVSVAELAAQLAQDASLAPSRDSESSDGHSPVFEFAFRASQRAIDIFLFASRELIPCHINSCGKAENELCSQNVTNEDEWESLLEVPYTQAMIQPYSAIIPTSLAQIAFAGPLRKISKIFAKISSIPVIAAQIEATNVDLSEAFLNSIPSPDEISAFNVLIFAYDKLSFVVGELTEVVAAQWAKAVRHAMAPHHSVPIKALGELCLRKLFACNPEVAIQLFPPNTNQSYFNASSELEAIGYFSNMATISAIRPIDPESVIEALLKSLRTFANSPILATVTHHALRCLIVVLENSSAPLSSSACMDKWQSVIALIWSLRYDALITLQLCDVSALLHNPQHQQTASPETQLFVHVMLQRREACFLPKHLSGTLIDSIISPALFIDFSELEGTCGDGNLIVNVAKPFQKKNFSISQPSAQLFLGLFIVNGWSVSTTPDMIDNLLSVVIPATTNCARIAMPKSLADLRSALSRRSEHAPSISSLLTKIIVTGTALALFLQKPSNELWDLLAATLQFSDAHSLLTLLAIDSLNAMVLSPMISQKIRDILVPLGSVCETATPNLDGLERLLSRITSFVTTSNGRVSSEVIKRLLRCGVTVLKANKVALSNQLRASVGALFVACINALGDGADKSKIVTDFGATLSHDAIVNSTLECLLVNTASDVASENKPNFDVSGAEMATTVFYRPTPTDCLSTNQIRVTATQLVKFYVTLAPIISISDGQGRLLAIILIQTLARQKPDYVSLLGSFPRSIVKSIPKDLRVILCQAVFSVRASANIETVLCLLVECLKENKDSKSSGGEELQQMIVSLIKSIHWDDSAEGGFVTKMIATKELVTAIVDGIVLCAPTLAAAAASGFSISAIANLPKDAVLYFPASVALSTSKQLSQEVSDAAAIVVSRLTSSEMNELSSWAWVCSWLEAGQLASITTDGLLIAKLSDWVKENEARGNRKEDTETLAATSVTALGLVLQAYLTMDDLSSVTSLDKVLKVASSSSVTGNETSTILPQLVLLTLAISNNKQLYNKYAPSLGPLLQTNASRHAAVFRSIIKQLGTSHVELLKECMTARISPAHVGQAAVAAPSQPTNQAPQPAGKLKINLSSFK